MASRARSSLIPVGRVGAFAPVTGRGASRVSHRSTRAEAPMKRTLLTRPLVAVAALLTSSACRSDSLTDPVQAVGHLIALDSLRTLDGQGLPTATLDGGTLTFYAAASYTDTVQTPAGLRSGACVQGVPNGAYIGLNGLVTLPDSSTYLLLPCSHGTFAIVLTRRVVMTDGSPRTEQDTLSHGLFTWKVDTLTLVDAGDPGRFTTSLARDTVTVTASHHRYVFEAWRVV